MDYRRMCCSLIVLSFVFFSISNVGVHGQSPVFVVTEFGAVPDGRTDSKPAFANAWKKACGTTGGVVLVPAGKTFLLSGGDFVGPCNGPTRFQIDGTLIALNDTKLEECWICFDGITGLSVVGAGVVDGNGASSWSRCGKSSDCQFRRPTTLKIHDVRQAVIGGITLVNSKMFHVNIQQSQYVRVGNVRIRAPEDSPNTDGIHIGQSTGVEIFDSSIGTGDDCVSLGDGSTNVSITGVACGPGHGISIGSLGKYKNEEDVRQIRVRNCTLTNTENGLRIKTWAPSISSNMVSDVTYSDINLLNVKNPVIIDQHYCPSGVCRKQGYGQGESSVKIEGVQYINVRGSSATEAGVDIQCSRTYPCKNVTFAGLDLTINGQKPATASCSNVDIQFQGSDPSRCA